MTSARGRYVALAVVALPVVIVALIALRPTVDRDVAASPSSSATPAVAASATATATPSATPSAAALPPGTFEDRVLGYRITFPQDYRRTNPRIFTRHEEMLGGATFTVVTEQQERERCQNDIGHVGFGPPDRIPDVELFVSRNPRNESAVQWVSTPRVPGAQPRSMHHKVEPVTINGLEAARLITDNAAAQTTGFAIRANQRMYEIYIGVGGLPTPTWLSGIANTFVAIMPDPFPSPAPTAEPGAARTELGQALARAFSARDADAVGRLILPGCHLAVGSTAPSGGHGRAIPDFIADLRTQFARTDFSVSVDPQVRVEDRQFGEDQYYVRSTWNESGRVTPIHLWFRDVEGRWYWFLAMHQHQGGASYSCLWAGSVGGSDANCR